MASKRRQRLSRNKRKREKLKELRRGLSIVIKQLKQENTCLDKKIKLEAGFKEKYFEMWRLSEKEKGRLRMSRFSLRCFAGKNTGSCSQLSSNDPKEVLLIHPSLLEDVQGNKVLGKGKFGTVSLKKFRESPVAVKYFDKSTSAKMVEKEASYLRQCCHLNLPFVYGMNNVHQPYFIVTQFYGINMSEAITLRNILKEDCCNAVRIDSSEQWLHVVTQLVDSLSYLHNKNILHNDIKQIIL